MNKVVPSFASINHLRVDVGKQSRVKQRVQFRSKRVLDSLADEDVFHAQKIDGLSDELFSEDAWRTTFALHPIWQVVH